MDRISVCKKWAQEYVVGLNLCPFASEPLRNDTIDWRIVEEMDRVDRYMLEFFHSDYDSVFLIFEEGQSFSEYLHWIELIFEVLTMLDLAGDLKVVTFHPDHIYENVEDYKAVNFANRSPLPMVQFLRQQQLAEIGMTEDWKAEILARNEDTLNSIGTESLKKKLDEYRKED